jgi:hypothetical protein
MSPINLIDFASVSQQGILLWSGTEEEEENQKGMNVMALKSAKKDQQSHGACYW